MPLREYCIHGKFDLTSGVGAEGRVSQRIAKQRFRGAPSSRVTADTCTSFERSRSRQQRKASAAGLTGGVATAFESLQQSAETTIRSHVARALLNERVMSAAALPFAAATLAGIRPSRPQAKPTITR